MRGKKRTLKKKRECLSPMLILTTFNLSVLSTYLPTTGESKKADAERKRAYTLIGRSVPGKTAARNSMEPNSKERLFHVERKCER